MIVVIDYDVGNVRNVCNALRHIGCDVQLSADTDAIKSASGLVLPGVAAFGYAVNALGELSELICQHAQSGKPLLGICVGFQMLFDTSNEHGRHKGLGLVGGNVDHIPQGRVIPHMGWNAVEFTDDMKLFAGLDSPTHFYFAHSYCGKVNDAQTKAAYADYGFELLASVQKDNIFGVQFHPEKSSTAGLKVLKNFADICERTAS
jgi:glutamine amidotransferase